MPEQHRAQDNILLDDLCSDESLNEFWDKVIQDIHNDPGWFNFADE
jgi:hypothetical protein